MVVKEHLRERLAELRLAHARGPQENERADRTIRILQARPTPTDGVAHRLDRLVLADHPLVQPLLEHEQLRPLRLDQPRHRNSGPGADDLGDLLGTNLATQEPLRRRGPLRSGLLRLLLRALLLQPLLQSLSLHVEFIELLVEFLAHRLPRRLTVLDLHARLVECELHLVELLPHLLRAAHAALLRLPLLPEAGQFLPQFGRLRFDLDEPLLGMLLRLLGELPRRQFQLHEPPLHLVDLARHALQFHRDPTRRLVHEVDRLVGQEPVGDVAMRQLRSRHEGRILDLHPLVMRLIPRLESPQDRDRVLHARLADHHRLKPPLEGRVFLDVLAVFVERRRADAPQLAAGQCRLEQVGRVGATFGSPGTDHGVQFVDEQDHVARRGLHLAQDRLQPVLELAAVFRAGDQGAEIKCDHPLAAECLRHVRLHDPHRQPLGDRRLAHARLADQHRIVLCSPREHLNHTANLSVAADHRIKLSLAGPLHQIDAIFLEGLKLLLRVLIGDPRLATHRL